MDFLVVIANGTVVMILVHKWEILQAHIHRNGMAEPALHICSLTCFLSGLSHAHLSVH